ncbi:carbonic anhydrase 2-like isoform X1 [Neocloeon triangulifer]|uniref:carbonic anhydrase 2-like isoform X1 n=1 Tax=Neocloeon triangulifer TaxID=2078957 RepID=UPI00286FA861|nr:carbonic anhydrase 2-like isoform X1 [Neocloeon triangulifer]
MSDRSRYSAIRIATLGLLFFVFCAVDASSEEPVVSVPSTGQARSLVEKSDSDELTGYRRWWSLLWPVASPINLPEADDRKMHYGYTQYNGPSVWSLEYPICGGNHQSPIDLSSGSMQRATGTPLRWSTTYWHTPDNMTLRNSGHTVELHANWGSAKAPQLSGGPLRAPYTFWQMHFHWGSSDLYGSEHTINNVSFPMEVHAVHFKSEYGSARNALRYPDGLAVVGFLYQMSNKPGDSLVNITPSLPQVRSSGSSSMIPPMPLATILSPPRAYATYQGSLTTPPCSEGVTWLVSGYSIPVSADQLAAFRSLTSHDGGMGDNFRPVQPLNGREVFYVSQFS